MDNIPIYWIDNKVGSENKVCIKRFDLLEKSL